MYRDSKAIISSALNTEITTAVLFYIKLDMLKSNVIDVEGIILLCRMPFLMNSEADHTQTSNQWRISNGSFLFLFIKKCLLYS